MREIKFRSWYDGRMRPITTWGFAEGYIMTPKGSDDQEEYEVMQYTGLKDTNGIEIYEGDIIKTNYTSLYGTYYKGVLKFGEYDQDGSGGEYNPEKCLGFYIESVNPYSVDSKEYEVIPDYMKTVSPLEFDSLEVIGNIHEHPHLLEVSTE